MGVVPVVVAAVLGLGPSGQESGSDADLPGDVVARVNGVDVKVSEYGRWLLDRHGWAYLTSFLEVVALRQEAARQGVVVGPEELDAAFAKDWDDNVLMRFRGDESAFLQELEKTGMGRAGWKARRMQTLETEELCRRLVVLARDPSEEQLRTTFQQEFGEDAVRKHLRVAYFDRLQGYTPRPGQVRLPVDELNAKAMDRAREFLAAVTADRSSWSEAVARDSDLCLAPRWDSYVRDLRVRGGEVPRYRKDFFEGALDKSLREAETEAGALLGPFLCGRGAYVVEVVAWEPVEFEAVRDEMKELFLTRPATSQEMYFYKQDLLERAAVRKNAAYEVRDG